MNKDVIKYSYYLKNGSWDPFLTEHPDCFIKNTYMILKNVCGRHIDPYNIFLSDITQAFVLIKPDRCLLEDDQYKSPFLNEFCKYTYYEAKNDPNVSDEIEKLLDKGHIIIAATVSEKLPHYIYYNPEHTYVEWEPGHNFLIIGYDKDHFYYVDEPRLLNNSHKSHSENKEVGIIEKSVIKDIFTEHLVFFTVEFNYQLLNETFINIYPIKSSIENYYKKEPRPSVYEKNQKIVDEIIYFGQEALKKAISTCIDSDGGFVIDNLLLWSDEDILRKTIGRRKVLRQWLLNYKESSEIISIINENIDYWETLRLVLIRRKLRENFYLEKDLARNFQIALKNEDKLIKALETVI